MRYLRRRARCGSLRCGFRIDSDGSMGRANFCLYFSGLEFTQGLLGTPRYLTRFVQITTTPQLGQRVNAIH